MPATQFICPDNNVISIEDCLTKGCRLAKELPAGRCLSIRTLRMVADQREWQGTPSTTQLIKGVREAYLEITGDYKINPQNSLYKVIGSKSSGFLDRYVDKEELGLESLADEVSKGSFDFYDYTNGHLFDTTTSSYFKVSKALGLRQVDVPSDELYKIGPKKGTPKMKKEWQFGGTRSILDWAIKINDYRCKLESIGFPVNQMFIEAICRHGEVKSYIEGGDSLKGTIIAVSKIPDRHIQAYLRTKKAKLMYALITNVTPPKCKHRETWGGRKCEKYCNVADLCLKKNPSAVI